jgi:hypothetical protein
MRTCLAFVALCVACGGSPRRPEPAAVVPAHKVAHYENQRFKIGAVIELADAEHPVIKLDGDETAERLERRGDAFVDREGRPILRFVDGESVVVFVHGGDVGVELGRDRDL